MIARTSPTDRVAADNADLAVALSRFAVGAASTRLGYFSDEGLKRADILALTKRVRPYVDHEMDKEWSRFVPPADVTVVFRDGTTQRARVNHLKGHPNNPMSKVEFAAKAADCARVAAVKLPVDTADRLIATVDRLETLPDLSDLMRVMTVATGCGHCRPCIKFRPALCKNVSASRSQGMLPNGARRLSLNGRRLYHYSGVLSFAQYAVSVPNTLIRIDPDIPIDIAAMFGCAVVTGAGRVFNSAKMRPGQNVAVLGLGGVGLNAVMAAKISGAAEIIGIDINQGKFSLAKDLGCTRTLSASDPDLIAQVKDLTQGGVDFAFEISGAEAAMTTANAITREGGDIICIGLSATNHMYQYVHAMLVGEEEAFRGSLMGSGIAERDIPLYLKFFRDGKMPVDRLKSESTGFDQLNVSLDLLDHGQVVRQILLPNG